MLEPLRNILIDSLRADAIRHELRLFADIGIEEPNMHPYLNDDQKTLPGDEQLIIAIHFWHGWMEQASDLKSKRYQGIELADWPGLARELADDLQNQRPVANRLVLDYFA
jgi:hypothetical protein